jgi:hypothetical protein
MTLEELEEYVLGLNTKVNSFEKELAVLKGRVDGLESRLSDAEYNLKSYCFGSVLMIDEINLEDDVTKRYIKPIQGAGSPIGPRRGFYSNGDSLIWSSFNSGVMLKGGQSPKMVKVNNFNVTSTGKDFFGGIQLFENYFVNLGHLWTRNGTFLMVDEQQIENITYSTKPTNSEINFNTKRTNKRNIIPKSSYSNSPTDQILVLSPDMKTSINQFVQNGGISGTLADFLSHSGISTTDIRNELSAFSVNITSLNNYLSSKEGRAFIDSIFVSGRFSTWIDSIIKAIKDCATTLEGLLTTEIILSMLPDGFAIESELFSQTGYGSTDIFGCIYDFARVISSRLP